MVRFIGSPGLRWAARATSGLQRIMISDWLQSRATSWRSGRMARNSGPSRRAGSLTALRWSGSMRLQLSHQLLRRPAASIAFIMPR